MSIQMIVAIIDGNNSIGNKGDLIIQIPEDMKHFKKKTLGSVVIMGSRTYESIPEKYRPLIGRINIPLSRKNKKYEDVLVLSSIEKALQKFRDKNVFIIGGGQIYKKALKYTEKILLTRIYLDVEGDVFFPDPKKNGFKRVWASSMKVDPKSKTKFRFESWKRN